ncbi:hypothetical protein C8R44DRAFT_803845 [Mycena epipterygia]|nr:hypothetical protein C8R44DRAFT_803845 [Mycena epipterygia]
MNYTVDPTVFSNYWEFSLSQVYATCPEILLYGIFLVLLAASVYLLYHRTGEGRLLLAIVTSLMAVLATLQLVVRVGETVLSFQLFQLAIQGEIWPHSARTVRYFLLYDRFYIIEDLLLVTNNLVTDSLFIYRCFIIWGRKIHVVILPILMLLITTVLGYISTYKDDYSQSGSYIDSRIPFLLSILTNVLLMALTAGRIWWIRRDACIVLESSSLRVYNTVIAIILESGAIYCLSITLYLISATVWNSDSNNFAPMINVLRGALPQIVNIAPTLIIVRVGLGRSVEDSSVHPARQDPPRRHTAGVLSTLAARAPTTESVVIDIHADRDLDSGTHISLTELGKQA